MAFPRRNFRKGRNPGRSTNRPLGRRRYSPGLGESQYTIAGHSVMEGDNYCSVMFGVAPPDPTQEELNIAATELQYQPDLLQEGDTGGGTQAATAGNSTYPSYPIVRRGAVVIWTAPGKQECVGTPGNVGNNLNPTDSIFAARYAEHKGFETGKDLICDDDITHRVAKRAAEAVRKAFIGQVKVVDENGKIGMDVFQGPEFTFPDDGSIWCGKLTSIANRYCSVNWSQNTTVNYAKQYMRNDSRFDPYQYILLISLGCWNTHIDGGYSYDFPGHNPEDDYRVIVWTTPGLSRIAGGQPGGNFHSYCVHPTGGASPASFNPDNQNYDPDSWNWAVNLWDLRNYDRVGYWYPMWLHEMGHAVREPLNSPNSGKLGGFRHEIRIGPSDLALRPHLDTLPCNFARSGPMDALGLCGSLDPGNTAGGMNYHDVMSYDVTNGTDCSKCWVPCSDPAPSESGYGSNTPYGMDSAFNTTSLHHADFLLETNVVDLTNIVQSVPNTIIFEDWLWATDLFHIHPELQSLGSRKVLIKQLMHTNLPHPVEWDSVVPAPKRRHMTLSYHARGYMEKWASMYTFNHIPIDSPDGVIYLNWGPQQECKSAAACAGGMGMQTSPTYARLDVIPSNPAAPLIIHGFDTEIPPNPATRFYGWKIETVGFTNEPEGGKTKVKIRITSLGEG